MITKERINRLVRDKKQVFYVDNNCSVKELSLEETNINCYRRVKILDGYIDYLYFDSDPSNSFSASFSFDNLFETYEDAEQHLDDYLDFDEIKKLFLGE